MPCASHVGQLLRLCVEYFDKVAADDLAFILRFGYAFQVGEEFIAGPDTDDVESHRFIRAKDVFEFVFAQQAHIHKDADQVLPDRLVQQHGGYGRIDTAGEAQYHFVVAKFVLQFPDGRFDKRIRRPVLFASANIHDKVFQQLGTFGRVVYLGVELDTPRLFPVDLESRYRDIFGAGDNSIIVRNARDCIAVRHPHLGSL